MGVAFSAATAVDSIRCGHSRWEFCLTSTIAHSPAEGAGSYGELLKVAIPLMLSAGTQSLMHVIDRVYLTWYSSDALAASLPAGMLYWSILSLPFGIAAYVNTFVAQYDGAGKKDRVAAAVWQGVYFSAIAGVLLTLLYPFTDEIFNAIGHGPEIAAMEATYSRWLLWGTVPTLLHSALSAFYSGRGQTMVVLVVNATCVSINAVLDYAFIFGWGPIPSMGIAGAAMTDVVGECLAVLILVGLMARPAVCREYPLHRSWRWDAGLQRDLWVYGGPSGLQMLIDVAGFAAFMMMIGWLGPRELAATNLAFNLNTLSFIPVIGIGIAVSTLVGQRIGEGHPRLAIQSTWKGFVIAGGYMLTAGVIYLALPDLLIAPYALHAESESFGDLRQTVVVLLRFVALYSFFDAMAIVFGSAIRGAGDTRFSLLLAIGSASLLLVIPTYLTWHWGYANLLLCWTYCSIYVFVLGVVYLLRFQNGAWMTMNVIHQPAAAVPEGADTVGFSPVETLPATPTSAAAPSPLQG
jgi:multidrug resistance protein, MATE family